VNRKKVRMAVISGTETLDAPLDHPREDGEDRTNLIINYLPQSMTDPELYSMFITLGPIVSAKIMRDKSSGYSFGYGFVQYESPNDAARAIEQLNGLQVANNKRIKVSYSRPNTADIKDTNLYVGNVPPGISESDLDALFGNYGSILTKKLLKDQSGKNKGIAFIRYSKKAEADEAMMQLNGYKLPGASRGLDVKVAEDHGRQKAAFYAGWLVGQGQGDGEWGDDYGHHGGGHGGGRGGGYGGRGGFGLQMFNAPGANVRGMGGNRYNPISRGGGNNFNNVVGGPINKHNQGFNSGGFSRGAFSGTRGMPARGGFARGGSRGGGPSWN